MSLHYVLMISYFSYLDNVFQINERSGEIYTLTTLDREQRDFYDLKIVAKDQGAPQLSSSTQLKINIIDANDNSPIFYPKEYFVRVPISATSKTFRLPLETPIVSLQASDNDLDDNSKIEFQWDSSNVLTQNHLRLDTETGEIFPSRSFSISYANVLKEGLETVKVYASDGGGKRSKESATIYLYSNKRQSDSRTRNLFQENKLTFSILEDNGLTNGEERKPLSRQGKLTKCIFEIELSSPNIKRFVILFKAF